MCDRFHPIAIKQPRSIENRNVECANKDAERRGRKCETGNEKDEDQQTRTH